MGRHRRPDGNDPTELLPTAVDDPTRLMPPADLSPAAIGEPASREGGHRRPSGTVIAAITAATVVFAAVVTWALSRPDDPAPFAQPELSATPQFDPGFDDGFGQMSPTPSPSRNPPTPTGSPPTPPGPTEATRTGVTATYRITDWEGGYKVDVYLANPTKSAANWVVRIKLPGNARLEQSWNAELDAGDGLTFTPPLWDNDNPRPVAPGGQHDFGFIVRQPSGQARLVSCTIDGRDCLPGG